MGPVGSSSESGHMLIRATPGDSHEEFGIGIGSPMVGPYGSGNGALARVELTGVSLPSLETSTVLGGLSLEGTGGAQIVPWVQVCVRTTQRDTVSGGPAVHADADADAAQLGQEGGNGDGKGDDNVTATGAARAMVGLRAACAGATMAILGVL